MVRLASGIYSIQPWKVLTWYNTDGGVSNLSTVRHISRGSWVVSVLTRTQAPELTCARSAIVERLFLPERRGRREMVRSLVDDERECYGRMLIPEFDGWRHIGRG